jgi:hypothetical protein
MYAPHFDYIARVLGRTRPRRRLLLGLAVSPFAGIVAPGHPPDAAARKRHKHTNKKRKKDKTPKPNAFGCLDVGAACKTAEQCCSNICEGKQGKRKCRAHDASTCSAGAQSDECGGTDISCTTSFLEPGICGTTTGNAGYCFPGTAGSECFACTTDVECQEANGGQWGPYAACLRCVDCMATGGTACAGPFGLPAIGSAQRID